MGKQNKVEIRVARGLGWIARLFSYGWSEWEALPQSSAATFSTSKVKIKLLPRPARDSTQMSPPCFSTIRLQVAKPMPWPSWVVTSPRSNGSKIFWW